MDSRLQRKKLPVVKTFKTCFILWAIYCTIRAETFTMCGTRDSFVIIKQGTEIEENFDRRSKSGEGGEKKES